MSEGDEIIAFRIARRERSGERLSDQQFLLRRFLPQRPRFLHDALYLSENWLGNGEQSQINWFAIAPGGAEDLDLASNAPIEPQHCRIEVTEDRFNACIDSDVAQGRNQNRGSKVHLLLIAFT